MHLMKMLKNGKVYSKRYITSFRSEEDQDSIMYFCRAKAGNFNYTNNPTFTSGSDNGFRQRTMEGNPQTFITTVGLYDVNHISCW